MKENISIIQISGKFLEKGTILELSFKVDAKEMPRDREEVFKRKILHNRNLRTCSTLKKSNEPTKKWKKDRP